MDVRCWRDATLDAETVATYDVSTFLWCNNYHSHPQEFSKWIRNVLMHVQMLNSKMRMLNDPATVLWNMDKHYLLELSKAGFLTPSTAFVEIRTHSCSSLAAVIAAFSQSRPVVLKPAISGSAKMTYLIKNPQALNQEDTDFIQRVVTDNSNRDYIIQEFQKEISSGEYSLIFINGTHTHTILKTPRAGEFRVHDEYGGVNCEVDNNNVPANARTTAQEIIRYVQAHVSRATSKRSGEGGLVYARIDGIMRGDEFVLMEVEALEPHLWLEAESGARALEELCGIFVQS